MYLGFIYDSAEVTEWQTWKDYAIGDIVKHKQFYYTAKNKVLGASDFDRTRGSQIKWTS